MHLWTNRFPQVTALQTLARHAIGIHRNEQQKSSESCLKINFVEGRTRRTYNEITQERWTHLSLKRHWPLSSRRSTYSTYVCSYLIWIWSYQRAILPTCPFRLTTFRGCVTSGKRWAFFVYNAENPRHGKGKTLYWLESIPLGERHNPTVNLELILDILCDWVSLNLVTTSLCYYFCIQSER